MPASLEDQINRFKEARDELDASVRAAHQVLGDLLRERRIDRLLSGEDVKKLVDKRVEEVIKVHLDKIGPEVRNQTNLIYDKVGREMDKLIDLSLGREFSKRGPHEDIRPLLAEKLKQWLRETIDTEGLGT